MTQRTWAVAVIIGLALCGCPDESSTDKNDAAGNVGKDGGSAADPAAKVGTFTIRLMAPKPAGEGGSASAGYTSIAGKVFTGPVPEEVAWDVDSEQGGCRLLKPRVPFCDPGCEQAVCVDDDECVPNPSTASVGVVTVSGLKATSGASSDVRVEPISGNYSTPAGVSLAYPAFEEGDELRLRAAGDAAAGFEVVSHGIAPLTLSTTSFPLKASAPLAVAWQAASKSENSRIHIKLDISHHGGTKGKIECDVPDNGSLSIAADLVSRLLKLGVAGFPTIAIDRVSSGVVATATGSVELKVVSEIEQAVEIDGLVSCDDNSDCPSQLCQSNLTCK